MRVKQIGLGDRLELNLGGELATEREKSRMVPDFLSWVTESIKCQIARVCVDKQENQGTQ